jgi:5'-methylthioadenosine nucleosidase
MAMRAEAEPILRSLGAASRELPGPAARMPFEWHHARRGVLDVVIAVNGRDPRHGVDAIGTQPAALNTFLTVAHWEPDLVISAGTAGGWAGTGAAVGEVYASRERFVYHDRRVELPGFEEYGIGSYPALDTSALVRSLGLKDGVVTTGNSLDESAADRRVIARTGAVVKDMEAAAVAEVAHGLGVPVMALKAITDLVDSHVETAEQFTANLALASRRLCETLLAVLDWCDGRRVGDLGGAVR